MFNSVILHMNILELYFSTPFYKIMVPTVDTVRYDFLVHNLVLAGEPVLLVGPVGTGKTSVAQTVLQKLDASTFSVLTINLSAQVPERVCDLKISVCVNVICFRRLPTMFKTLLRAKLRREQKVTVLNKYFTCVYTYMCDRGVLGVYVPIGGKKLVTFMDDFNMPAKDTFGSQPPLELIRQWIDYGFWYDRLKQIVKQVKVKREIKNS